MGFGVYIHWPFCLSKCPYCDFYKEVRKNVPQDEIIAGYKRELDFYYQYTSDKVVSSVFFGGGTPSLIKPENIAALIDYIAGRWKTAPDCEISLEANPNSDYPQMFADLRRAGINRLSLGVQALNEADLRFLGRTHNLAQAYQAIDEVLQNFDNHSLDLIYARPQQKLSDWEKELEQAASFGLRHLSLYQLTIEEGTVFARKGIKALDDEAAGEMYLFTEDYLADKGIYKYEVSNYARFGFASRHNLLYWTGQDYIGIGPSAHGRFCFSGFKGNLEQKPRDRKISRTSLYAENFSPLVSTLSSALKPEKSCIEGEPEQKRRDKEISRTSLYAENFSPLVSTLSSALKPEKTCQEGNSGQLQYPIYYASTYNCQLEELSQTEKAEELLLMGLRLVDGIDKRRFKACCGLDFDGFVNQERLKYLCSAGLLVDTPEKLRAAREGFLVLNELIGQLCP
ncbi:MAG: radical SAM family heme chaperone HemW [Alphaproteobacteria bacterium]|nr:radical SAM family heme chaperone HemW [Alphaproteobacteria bacterium]